MIKTYKMTIPARNYSMVIRGKTNNVQRFNFTGGDPVTGKAATIVLHSQYSQTLLEESDFFKKGYVTLLRVSDGGETPVEEKKEDVTVKEDITSPEQLIEFVAMDLEKVFKRPDAALEFAKKRGFSFPNLDLGK